MDIEIWKLSFQNERRGDYGGSACVGTSFTYCKTWVDDRSVFTGNLQRTGDTWILAVSDGSSYSAKSSSVTDSVRISLKQEPYCNGYFLTVAAIGPSIVGTFSYSRDCHGAYKTGSFSGSH